MDIPPPWVPPRPFPPPRDADPVLEADPPEGLPEAAWRRRFRQLRERLGRLLATESGASPLDPLDIFRSAVVQLVQRVLRAFGFIAIGVAVGAWGMGWQDVDWGDPRDWPTPWKFLRDVDTLEAAAAVPMMGVGLYALSFVGCLRVIWLLPVWLLGFLVQIHWAVRCISEEDEEPWLLPVVVPLVAWQVFCCLAEWPSSWGWRSLGDSAIPGALFLTGFTVCWVSVLWTWRWLSREGLTPWSMFERRQYPFDPAVFRWRGSRGSGAVPPAAMPPSQCSTGEGDGASTADAPREG